jgi:ABC-type phosphate transport system substrate-binding protein
MRIIRLTAAVVLVVVVLAGCGDDDATGGTTTSSTASSTTASTGSTTTTEPATGAPTAAFCQAWADYQAAQDGAQLNTALGAMQEALPPDAPGDVANALVTLGQGDLDPGDVQAASDTVADWADGPCAER